MSFAVNNHYNPQAYLHRFSNAGKVQVYRTLVPDARFPVWKGYSPAAIAHMRHLYTRVDTGTESDEVEKWMNREIEDPAHPVIEAVVTGKSLTKSDWRILVRFLAAQDVRTPAYLGKHLRESNELIPKMLDQTLDDVKQELENVKEESSFESSDNCADSVPFPMRIHTQKNGSETMLVQLEVLGGRSSWLWEVQRILDSTWEMLTEHRWTVLEPSDGINWFTTDNPVMKVNFHSSTSYNFGGGWNSNATEIMMPLSPRHLLYCRTGEKPPQRGHRLSSEKTLLIKRLTAEHASRLIYACEPDATAEQARKRVVDRAIYKSEKEAIENFHRVQTEAELDMLTRPTRLLDPQ